MSKSKEKKENLYYAIESIQEAIDRIEGEYSNIPFCCIDGYISGRTYASVLNSLDESDQKKLQKWNYVPCNKCFKENKRNKLKKNGMSDIGHILIAVIKILSERKKNA